MSNEFAVFDIVENDNPFDLLDVAQDDAEKKSRKDTCGLQFYAGINPLTGRPSFRVNRCGCWDCDKCMGFRATEMKMRVEKAQNELETLGLTIFLSSTASESEIANIRSLKKDMYISFPQAIEGEFVFCYAAEKPITESSTPLLDTDTYTQEEWMEMTRKRPYKSRRSGNLGATKNEETAQTEKVKILEMTSDKERFDDVRAAIEEARAEVNANPTTAEEVETAIKEIVMLAGEKLQAKKIEYHTTYKTWHIETSRISWNALIRDNFNARTSRTQKETLEQLEIAQLAQFSS